MPEQPVIATEPIPTPVTFRPGTLTDLGSMALVLERATAGRDNKPLPDIASDWEKIYEIESRLNDPTAWAHMAIEGGQPAGFVLGHGSRSELTIESNPEVEYLALLMVEPKYWGRQIGSRLLDMAAQEAVSRGKKSLVLWTAASNVRGRRLYERKGYYLKQIWHVNERQGVLEQYKKDL